MSSLTEKSPKESSWGNDVKITEAYTHFLLLTLLWFHGIYCYISARMLPVSKLNIPLKSSCKDKSFGTKIITLG